MLPTRAVFLSTSLSPVPITSIPSGSRTCAICLQPYTTAAEPTEATEPAEPAEPAEEAAESTTPSHPPVRLPCTHTFGLPCLLTWLHQDGVHTCPLDRRPLFRLPPLTVLHIAGASLPLQWLYDPLVHLRAVLADEWRDADTVTVRAAQLAARLPRRRGDAVLPGFWGPLVLRVAETGAGRLAQDVIGRKLGEVDGSVWPVKGLYDFLESVVLRQVGSRGEVLPERFGVFVYRVLRYLVNWQRLLQGGRSRGAPGGLDAFYVSRSQGGRGREEGG